MFSVSIKMYDTLHCWSQSELCHCHWFIKSGLSKLSVNHTEFSWNGNVSSKVKWKILEIFLCASWFHLLYLIGDLHYMECFLLVSYVLTIRKRRTDYFLTKIMKSVVAPALIWETFWNPYGEDTVELEEISSFSQCVACFYVLIYQCKRNIK